MHTESVMKLAAIQNNSCGIGSQLSTPLLTDQRHHRVMLMKLLGSIKYLARQGLPLRGRHEDNESFQGNLYQLLLLQAAECPEENVASETSLYNNHGPTLTSKTPL